MANKIILKKSSVATKVPLASDLEVGEIAVNLVDQKLYSKNAGGSVILVGSGLGGSGDVQGPSSATDNALARFDATTGKIIQDSVVIVDDSGNMSGVNSIADPDYIAFNTSYATTLSAGQLGWDGNNTLGVGMAGGNVIQHIGEDSFFYCKASSAITKGQVVMFTGAVGASGVPTGAPATGITDGSYIMGIAAEAIALNGFGLVQSFGTLRNVNTSGFADGDILWYNPAVTGGLTATKPSAPNVKVQMAAVINGGSSGGGTILIRINAGSTLGGTDSNAQITGSSNGQLITYDGGNGYYKNTSLTGGSGISVSASANGVLTVANSGVLGVTATSPVASSGGQNPVISMPAASASQNGYLTSTDWSTFNGKTAIPSGTAMLFVQSTAPTGWTKSTTHNDKALRVVSGAAGTGGTVAFTTAFASQAVNGTNANTTATNNSYTPAGSVSVSGSVGATTLDVNSIPAHSHLYQAYGLDNIVIAFNGPYYISSNYPIYATSNTGGGGSHSHGFSGSGSFSGSAATITQAAHTHTFTGTAINLAVQYVDVIIATKD